MRGAPNHRCGQPMELGVVDRRLCFYCVGCYPKFPERTKGPLHCPKCGEALKMQPWPREEHDCVKCERWYVHEAWDRKAQEPGMLPVYEELDDGALLHWTEKNVARLRPWGK